MITSKPLDEVVNGLWVCRPRVVEENKHVELVLVKIDNSYPNTYEKLGIFDLFKYNLNRMSGDSFFISEEVSDFTGQIDNYYAIFSLAEF